MAAASPRKPRRSGRHRKPSNFQTSACAQWLRVGAVGIGLAAALVGGQGVASAAADDPSSSGDSSSNADASGTSANQGGSSADTSGRAADSPKSTKPVRERRHDNNANGGDVDTPRPNRSAESTSSRETAGGAGSGSEQGIGSDEPERRGNDRRAWETTESDLSWPRTGNVHRGQRWDSEAAPSVETGKSTNDPEFETPVDDPVVATEPIVESIVVIVETAPPTVGTDETDSATVDVNEVFTEALNQVGLGEDGGNAPLADVVGSLWLAARQTQTSRIKQHAVVTTTTSALPLESSAETLGLADTDMSAVSAAPDSVVAAVPSDSASRELGREARQAEFNRSVGWIPLVGTVVNAVSFVGNLAQLGTAVLRGDGADIVDEISDLTRDFIGMAPVVGAPIAAGLYDRTVTKSSVAATGQYVSVLAAAVPPVGSNEHFLSTLQTVIDQLSGFNPADDLTFRGRTEITFEGENFRGTLSPVFAALETALDAHSDVLDAYMANPQGLDSQLLRLGVDLIGLFVASAIPDATFSDKLNMMGDLLNRFVPPYEVSEDATIFTDDDITTAQIAGGAVGALVNILDRMLEGDWTVEDLQTPATTGGLAGFTTPYNVDDMTFLTDAEPTIFTVPVYLVLVAAFNRFKQVGTDMPPVITGVTQGAQFGFTIPIYIDYYDPNADNVTFEVAQNGEHGTISPIDGGYLYTPFENQFDNFDDTVVVRLNGVNVGGNIVGSSLDHPYAPYGTSAEYTITVHYGAANQTDGNALFARNTNYNYNNNVLGSQYAAGSFDAVDQNGHSVTFSGGQTYTSVGGALVTINSSSGGFTYTNTNPGAAFFHRSTSENPDDRYDTVVVPVTAANGTVYSLTFRVQIVGGSNSAPSWTPSLGAADGLGIRRSSNSASDGDGDVLTYSLVNPGTTGATSSSIYTSNGSIVQLNTSTGAITYIPKEGVASESFQVRVSDGHGGTTTQTVLVTNGTTRTLTYTSPNPETGVIEGALGIPAGDVGLLTYSLGATPANGTVIVNANGSYTYTRTGAGADTFTIIGTDSFGKSTTIKTAAIPAGPILSTSWTPGTFSLNTANATTSTQTTTGQFSATVANGLTVVWPTYATTANGGVVSINPDGTFTYTITREKNYFHQAAKIGASGTAVQDYFHYAVYDNLAGQSNIETIYLPIYAVNSAPTISNRNTSVLTFGGITKSDADGDQVNHTSPAKVGSWGGSVSGGGSGTGNVSLITLILNLFAGPAPSSGQAVFTITVTDGYYVVDNGVVTGTPASYTRTYYR